MLVLTFALVTSCTNTNHPAAVPPGSSANPQTGMKKESGAT
jgi:hypothetical protein